MKHYVSITSVHMATQAFPGECLHNAERSKTKTLLRSTKLRYTQVSFLHFAHGPCQAVPTCHVHITLTSEAPWMSWDYQEGGSWTLQALNRNPRWLLYLGPFCLLPHVPYLCFLCILPQEKCPSLIGIRRNLAVTLLAFKAPLQQWILVELLSQSSYHAFSVHVVIQKTLDKAGKQFLSKLPLSDHNVPPDVGTKCRWLNWKTS